MISKPKNWSEVKEFTEWHKLPLDAYVCKVKQAAVQSTDNGNQMLCILFDIAEGEEAGYYTDEFKLNTRDDRKWKGVLRVWLPKDDGSEKDEWTKSTFKGMVTSFEKSNPGYQWNWDEKSLAGKMVGILFRNEEWDYNSKTGWAVRPFRALSVDSVRNGEYTLPAAKPLQRSANYSYSEPYSGYSSMGASPVPGGFSELDDDDGELPF